MRRNVIKIITIIIISIFLIGIVSIQLLVNFFYNKGLIALPKDLAFIDNYQTYSKFNRYLWISEAGNIPIKIKPINHFEYLGSILLNSKDLDNLKKTNNNNGWNLCFQTSRLLISKTNYKTSPINWQLSYYSISVWISRNLNANKCLNIIANEAYFGNNFFGIKNASIGYFNKNPEELTDNEIIYLLTVIKAPDLYDKIKHPDRFEKRSNEIKNKLFKNKY